METIQGLLWRGSNFTLVQTPGRAPDTVIFRFAGPFTARDMHSTLSPVDLRNLFEPQGPEQKALYIFDLTKVPYIDSAGLGMLVSQFSRCQGKGVRLVLAGVNPRVLQLLQITRLNNLLPMAATVEEAEGGQ
jgi:anti-anti-sigma factor